MSNQNFPEDPLAPRTERIDSTDPLATRSSGTSATDPLGSPPFRPRSTSQPEPPAVSTSQDDNSRADVAKDEARQVSQEGAAAGRHVADTAKGEAQNVAQEAKGQAQSLMHTLQHDLSEQAGTQQKRAAEGLKSVSDELRSMAENSEQNGIATQWVQEAASRLGGIAGWLDDRDPSSVLEETKRFARNRPGTFLAIAAGAGLVAGRLARSLKENSSGSDSGSGSNSGTDSNSSTGSPASSAGSPVSSQSSVPSQAGDRRRDPLEGGVPATGAPETRTAPGYPSQPPAYPTSSPSAAPSRVDPTFPDDGTRGLN